MDRRRPPRTEEGWYALHDFRRIDWNAWRDAPERERDAAIEEGVEYLSRHEAVADADAGGSAVFSVLGNSADLLVLHLRPTMAHLDTAERRFERTALAGFTEQTDSYLSVTEVSGYMSEEYFEGREARSASDGTSGEEPRVEAVEDSGMARYIESRLKPDVPDSEYVSFYPMDKRRDPEYNWYDLSFEERADLMSGHGDIGREYAGKVTQIITGSVGFDDHEWGVTLFADDPAQIKKLLYEMRFDPSSSRYAEFGRFRFGRRFPPEDLGAFLAGDPIPTTESDHPQGNEADGQHPHRDADDDEDMRDALEAEGIYAGQPHGEDVHAVVLYSGADPEELAEEVSGLRGNFEHYDTHVKTAVYQNRGDGNAAVVSIWDTQSASETASGFLADLPGIVSRTQAEEGEDTDTGAGFGTMGMFYTTKPDHREEFVTQFDAVGELLEEMEGHRESDLLVNREDENDMFISSQWRSRDDAMAFFRSDAFSETVSFGREVLADRPRHVFLT